jgi:hypothetical protein
MLQETLQYLSDAFARLGLVDAGSLGALNNAFEASRSNGNLASNEFMAGVQVQLYQV